MWVVSAACRVGGRLLQPGEPLPDLTPAQVERLQRARCIERVEPVRDEPHAVEPAPVAERPAKPNPKAKPKPKRKRK